MVHSDTMHVIHARAAGPDVHKMQITTAVRLARPWAEAEVFTPEHGSRPSSFCTAAASPSWPLRKSTARVATTIRVPPNETIMTPLPAPRRSPRSRTCR